MKKGEENIEFIKDRPGHDRRYAIDWSMIKRELGWNPQKTSFEQLVKIMVDADMAKVAVERASQQVRTNLAEYLEKGIVK